MEEQRRPDTGSDLELLPAVDVSNGQVVPGGGDPFEVARRWQELGARWIHLVDLDAAFGRGRQRALLTAIVGALDVPVQLSGGIHDDDSLAAALAAGCHRAVVGTTALGPEFELVSEQHFHTNVEYTSQHFSKR